MLAPRVIVFTDLDGTLLDHHTYSYMAALPALAQLKEHGIPVVINTSKTAAEIEQLRGEIGNTDPYVVENGSAIMVPTEHPPLPIESPLSQDLPGKAAFVFGEPRHYILQRIEAASQSLGLSFTGYNQWQAADVAQHTGLSLERAELSLQRDFSEPILWQHPPEDRRRLAGALAPDGLHLLVGGRFTHVVGKGGDKGVCLKVLKAAYTKPGEEPPLTIALGDSPNDTAMLEAADIAIIIRSPVKQPPAIIQPRKTPRLVALGLEPFYLSEGCGPVGWAEIMGAILNKFQSA